ncbi:glutamate receptor-interacting protein 2 [Planococcus citri]|uniref:glutamate receptor-interacting protein 2 n=1 Tax=Planococcus citri TaxID=170843 RepID=UPI0031F99F40
MFSFKSSNNTLKNRPVSKEIQPMPIDVQAPDSHGEEDDTTDVSCAPSFKCQQPFNKCSLAKACGKQTKASKCNAPNLCVVKPTTTEQDCCTHSDAFLPVNDKYSATNEETIYVTVKKIDVFIERDEEGNLGLTLQGGVHQNPQLNRPLVVTHVRPGGPTDKEGTIQVGDRLLAVDGYSLSNVTLNEAYNVLRTTNNQPSSRLTIEYDITNMKTFNGPLLVEMESPHPHQLGLTLTNTPHNAAVLIDEIKTASIAERCGALHPGDQILSVNDTRIEGSRMPATEVYKLLRICGGTHSNLLLQILPASAFIQNQPKTQTSFDSMYHNYYEVPNEYLVPHNVLHNEPVSKNGKTKRLAIALHSDDRLGYGLSIHSLPKFGAPVISSITPGGPADLCDCLQVNDRILSINGMPIAGITSEPQPLHRVPGVALGMIELEVEYDEFKPYMTYCDNTVTLELTKYNKKNLGITMTGSSECMLISDIKPGSVADRCGVFSIGDKILSINHQVLAKCSVQEALSILHSSSDTVSLQVEKQFVETSSNSENVEYTVQLNKQNGPIGITITGSEVIPRKITISALTPGGLAEKTGALHVGDRVLEIDDHDVRNVLLSEAITLLQNTGDKVLFKVCRNTPSSYENFTADDVHNRIYGSPGLLSDDSAVESWESSTQRDVSPNDTPFQHIQQHISEENEHIIPNVIIPQNNTKIRLDEPVYSNIPFHAANNNVNHQYTLPYYNRIPFHENYKLLSNIDMRNQRVLMSSSYADDYNNTFSNVDEIFSIADFHENEIADSTSKIHQVVLFKDPLYEDFGFSISDGLYERGVFINRIRQGGPADKRGVLQPFDRILQVNNTHTEDFDCCLTVPLIAAAGEKITLTVKRKNRAPSVDSRRHTNSKVVPWMEKAPKVPPNRQLVKKLSTTHTI